MANIIHPSSIIEDDVLIGDDNYIGPYCHIYSGVIIGNGNRIEGYSSIGAPAEKQGYFIQSGPYYVTVGDSNIIREFTTLNAGTRRQTKMGNHCTMLRGSHLSHDTILEDNVTLSCTVMVGGESYVMNGSNIGLGAVLHQFSIVGSYAMIGMGAVCTKTLEIKPGGIYVGNPARYLRPNIVGLTRNGISDADISKESLRWAELRSRN